MAEMVRETIVQTGLDKITRREVGLYAANSDTSTLYSIFDEKQKLYAVVSVPQLPRQWPSRIVVMAQVVGDNIVVIEDITDKPLVEALMANGGIPREKIVLAYKGEMLPT